MHWTVKWLQEPFFKPFMKQFLSGEILFHQGEAGNQCLLILSGSVQLLMESEIGEYVFAIQRPGDFLGEKALLSSGIPRQRIFSAQADGPVTVLQIGFQELELFEKENVQWVVELLKQVVESEAIRLDKANYLARILRGSDNKKRFLHSLVYLAQITGKKVGQQVEIPTLIPALDYYLGLAPAERDALIHDLEKRGLLKKGPSGQYLLTDEKSLLSQLNE
ncbi:Crp/Fnr family transcriptional regulator [bacterium]|nr:Crp/Fnr family transcriptional regulator [bacterium]